MPRLLPLAKPRYNIVLIGEETVFRNKPCYLRDDEEHLFASEYRRTFDEGYCAMYENTLVVSKGSATQGMGSIAESVHTKHMSLAIKTKMHVRRALYRPMVNELKTAILATDHLSSGYFHWIGDVLPKIVLMQDILAEKFSEVLILLPHSYAKPYCFDSLRLIGVNQNRIFIIPKGHKVRVKYLYVVGDILSPCGSGNFRPSLMKRIRTIAHEYLAKTKQNRIVLAHIEKKKRVYISRNDAAYRCIQNENALLPVLKKHNFTIVTTTNMSVLEQIEMCSTADILLSVHGAGLTNMIWMHSNTKVGEIRRSGDAHNNCYFSLSCALNISYSYSMATSDIDNTHKASLTWDITEATRFIEQLVQ